MGLLDYQVNKGKSTSLEVVLIKVLNRMNILYLNKHIAKYRIIYFIK